jgi:gamma-glutamylcyclotransferase (GGCT)/AIG2-like uncharacterized protein YtfP
MASFSKYFTKTERNPLLKNILTSMYIFVYGTLKKAYKELNSFTIAFHTHTKWICDTAIKGNIYLTDWYPALKLTGTNLVYGEVYEINSTGLLQKLDEYEHALSEEELKKLKLFRKNPCEYIRKQITIEGMECWIYEYLGEVDTSTHIKSGVFEMD